MTHTTSYDQTYSQFADHTAQHQLTVLREDGLYRHLRMAAPGTNAWSWEVITWPGHLAIVGDIADGFMFRRTNDMIAFFSSSARDTTRHGDAVPRLDVRYWAEKLCGRAAAELQHFSPEVFLQLVDSALEWHEVLGTASIEELVRDGEHEEADVFRAEQESLQRLAREASSSESSARAFLREHSRAFGQDAFYEWELSDWTSPILHACFAIHLTTTRYNQLIRPS